MLVVDASALLDLLLRLGPVEALEARLLDPAESLHAPHVIDLEALQVLRRFARRGAWQEDVAGDAVEDLARLRIARHPHDVLRGRIWELRSNATAYDAAYLALAEALDCPLVTRDARLSSVPGHHAIVQVV